MGIGDWGLGMGDWGLGPIPNPQSPIPNPQTPIPNPQSPFLYLYLNYKTKLLKYNYFIKFKKIFLIKRFYQK